MNSRTAIALIGGLTIAMGLAGLLAPGWVMGLIGLEELSLTYRPQALGEMRAVYGGLVLVLGAFTLQASIDPAAHRGRLFMIALLWLGMGSARALAIVLDGNPGLLGWVYLVTELGVGSVLLTTTFAAAESRPAGGGAEAHAV